MALVLPVISGWCATRSRTRARLLHFALRPLDTARAVALQSGLVAAHAAAVGLASSSSARRRRRGASAAPTGGRAWRRWCAGLPLIAWQLARRTGLFGQLPLLIAIAATVAPGDCGDALEARYRHGSQAFRLTLLSMVMVVPAFAFYPATVQVATRRSPAVETVFCAAGAQPLQTLQQQLERSLEQITSSRGWRHSSPNRDRPRVPRLAATELSSALTVTSSVELFVSTEGWSAVRFNCQRI